ncbi:hypothetical protein ACHWQZ_G014377 [Mnemiopsis leidyi]
MSASGQNQELLASGQNEEVLASSDHPVSILESLKTNTAPEDDDEEVEDDFQEDDQLWEDDQWDDQDSQIVDPEGEEADRLEDDQNGKYSDEEDEGLDSEEVNFNENVLEDEARLAVRNKRGRRFERIEFSNRLTDEFKLLMGEANLAVAKGDRKTAINICLEIIRNIPESPAPYETLSVIFEEENDLYKSLQYGLVSAHLWPRDPLKWYGLAQKCIELNDKENEKVCMSKALRYSHLIRDKGFIEDVISYFVKPGSTSEDDLSEETAIKLAIGYRKLIKISSESDKDDLISMVENFENRCSNDSKKEEFWAKTYVCLIETHPNLATLEKIIKVCKLYLAGKHYSRIPGFLVLSEYVAVEYVRNELDTTKSIQDQAQERLEQLQTAAQEAATVILADSKHFKVRHQNCPQIIRAALVAALIYLDQDSSNVEELLGPLLAGENIESLAEELALVADAYFNTRNSDAAMPIYKLMSTTCCPDDSRTLVQLGLSYEDLGEWEEAVRCYEKVLSLDDSNETAKLRLFCLQQEHMAEHGDKFTVNIHADLSTVKELSSRPDVVKLSYHRSNELISSGDYPAALEEGYKVIKTALFESIEVMQSKSQTKLPLTGEVLRGSNTSSSAYNLLCHVTRQKLGHNRSHCELYRDMLTREEWYDWYVDMLACCMSQNQIEQGFVLCLAALSSRLIDISSTTKDMQIHSLYLAGVLNQRDYISENIGALLYANPDMPGIWNIFYSIKHRLPQYRLHRLGVRWLHKNRSAFNGLFLNMQNSYSSRHYKAAIAFFRQLLGQRPRDSTIYFYLSLFYLHYSCSKGLEFVSRRHEMAVQAIACILMYHQLRGPSQETYFNIGRCYHHLGLFHFAIQYYNKVLLTPPSVPKDVQAQIDKMNKSLARNREKSGDLTSTQTKSAENPDAPQNRDDGPAEDQSGSTKNHNTDKTNSIHENDPLSSDTAVVVQLSDIDLTHEAVFNMCQIYEACGSEHLARQLMYQYAVV